MDSREVMIKRIIICLCIIGMLMVTWQAYGMDLIEAYQEALLNDPTFKEALADYLQDKQATAISRSALLPQLSVDALFSRNRFEQSGIRDTVNAHDLSIFFSQTIFDAQGFAALAQAHAVVKQAAYRLAAAQQNLMLRVATAYFQVLRAEDILKYTYLQREANYQQLNIIIERMKAGHTTITAVDQSRASYDFINARYVREKIDLANAEHALEAIVGVPINHLAKLKVTIPLIMPIPNNVINWERIAQHQNLQLLSTHYGAIAARRAVSAEQAGHLPTVNLIGQYFDTNEPVAGAVAIANLRTKEALGGININYPVLQGGFVVAQVHAAIARYQKAIAQMEFALHEAIANARNAYTGVVLGVNEIRASKRAVISNRDAYIHTLESYKAGMETVLNLLQQQNQLYDAERNYATNRYLYILNIIRLEEAAGILKPITLVELNRWLTSSRNLKKPYYHHHSHNYQHSENNHHHYHLKTTWKEAIPFHRNKMAWINASSLLG